jgi:hypothetical protein
MTTADLESRCAQCGVVPPDGLHACAHCSFTFCIRCALSHELTRLHARQTDMPTFCEQVEDYAALHAMFRREQEWFGYGQDPPAEWFPEPIDWQAARRAYASSIWEGPRC